jgi:hypothetical protein
VKKDLLAAPVVAQVTAVMPDVPRVFTGVLAIRRAARFAALTVRVAVFEVVPEISLIFGDVRLRITHRSGSYGQYSQCQQLCQITSHTGCSPFGFLQVETLEGMNPKTPISCASGKIA